MEHIPEADMFAAQLLHTHTHTHTHAHTHTHTHSHSHTHTHTHTHVHTRTGSRTWKLPPVEIRPEDSQEATETALENPFVEVRHKSAASMLLLFDATVEIPLSGFDTAQISSKHTFVV